MHNTFLPTGVGDAVERNPQWGKSFINRELRSLGVTATLSAVMQMDNAPAWRKDVLICSEKKRLYLDLTPGIWEVVESQKLYCAVGHVMLLCFTRKNGWKFI